MLNWLKAHKWIVFIVLILVGFIWYRVSKSKQVKYTEYSVTRQNITESLELSGKVKAEKSATLRFSAGGLITYLGAKTGDPVKKWQTLASVDSRQLQKILEQKLNLYAIQRGTFDQTTDDNNNTVPGGELADTLKRLLEKNQYQLDNTVKDVEYQSLSVSLAKLVSPIEGILIQSPITTVGVQVLPSDTWIVVDPKTLYLSADLDETDLAKVSIGQKVVVVLDAFPNNPIDSVVGSIAFSPKETTSGTTYEVKIGLSSAGDLALRLGLNGTASVVLSEKSQVNTLPSSAFSSVGTKMSVLRKEGKKYQETTVETGIENAGVVEILSGLSEGDHVYSQN